MTLIESNNKQPITNTEARIANAIFGTVLMNLVVWTKNDMLSLH